MADSIYHTIYSIPPFSKYRDYINVYRINITSLDSGISIPLDTVTKRTTFNTWLDAEASSLYFNETQVIDSVKVFFPEWSSIIQHSLVAFVVNEPGWSAGAAVRQSLCYTTLANYPGHTILHELGHELGWLADEYTVSGGNAQGDPEANVSYTCNRDSLKWKSWISSTTPLPTPYPSLHTRKVGAFEGAKYQARGIYRPELYCLMRWIPNMFCRICTEQLVKRLHQVIKVYDSFSPNNITFYYGESDTFIVNMIDTINTKFAVQWTLDNTLIRNGGFKLSLNTSTLGTSMHTLKCRFTDTTNYKFGIVYQDSVETTRFVRNDPDSVMSDSIVWTLHYGTSVEAINSMASITPELSVLSSGSSFRITAAAYGNYNLGIFDVRGRLIKQLGSGLLIKPATYHYRTHTSGIYFVRLISKGKIITKKAIAL